MPQKNTETPTLYIVGQDGEYRPLGHITEVELTEEPDDGAVKENLFSMEPMEFTETVVTPIRRRMQIFILTGKWLPNNWLRMHGLPMERKGYKGRRKSYGRMDRQ